MRWLPIVCLYCVLIVNMRVDTIPCVICIELLIVWHQKGFYFIFNIKAAIKDPTREILYVSTPSDKELFHWIEHDWCLIMTITLEFWYIGWRFVADHAHTVLGMDKRFVPNTIHNYSYFKSEPTWSLCIALWLLSSIKNSDFKPDTFRLS